VDQELTTTSCELHAVAWLENGAAPLGHQVNSITNGFGGTRRHYAIACKDDGRIIDTVVEDCPRVCDLVRREVAPVGGKLVGNPGASNPADDAAGDGAQRASSEKAGDRTASRAEDTANDAAKQRAVNGSRCCFGTGNIALVVTGFPGYGICLLLGVLLR